MLIINNIEHEIQDIKTTFGLYNVSDNGNTMFGGYNVSDNRKKRNSEAPFIKFYTKSNVFVGVETVYDKRWLQELKLNYKKDITRYTTDITFEDEAGWVSLITGTYTCFLERISQNEFKLELSCKAYECDEEFNILISENIIHDL